MSFLTASARRVFIAARPQCRSFSSLPARSNVATSSPLTSAVHNVAEHAQRTVTVDASAEGFKAGVVYTLLAGSVATAGILLLTPTGARDVQSRDLL